VRTDAESAVITVWVVLALLLLFASLYFALAGVTVTMVVVLVGGELVLGVLAKLALRLARPRR
jgi:hypothetical protein